MKTHTIIKSAVLLVLTIICTSCSSDILDTVPQTNIPESEAYNTPGKILAQVNNLYGQLQNPTFYGGRFIIFNEQRADEFGQNDGNAATGSAVWNQNVASTNEFINNVWSAPYTAINASNILIERLSETTVVSPEEAKFYIAEAKLVRALSYLCLIQTYAKPYNYDKNGLGVPLRLTAITSAGNNNLARSKVGEVYTQIVKDLDDAEKDLPENYATALLNTSRAHKSTAIALKTRVYLNMNEFTKVIEEASKIVSNTVPFQYRSDSLTHILEPDIATVFTGSYVGTESVFSIPFANSTTETPPAQSSLAFNYLKQPIVFLAAEGIAKDPALNDPADARSHLVDNNVAKQKVLKKFAITTAPFRDYVPVIRYAEVLLNYAEAAAYSDDLTKATSLLQAVRNRSNPSYVFPNDVIVNKEVLVKTIITERRIELLGEGLRLQDLQRNLKTLPAKTGSIGTAPLVLISSGNYIWPIPSGEISTNNLMEPNP